MHSPTIERLITRKYRTASKLHPLTVEKLRDYLRANLDQRMTSVCVAERMRLPQSYLCRAFKETFGMSLAHYVRELRMERACELMVNTTLPLIDIAYECGLTDQPHLCNCFRGQYGMAPNQWRQAALAGRGPEAMRAAIAAHGPAFSPHSPPDRRRLVVQDTARAGLASLVPLRAVGSFG